MPAMHGERDFMGCSRLPRPFFAPFSPESLPAAFARVCTRLAPGKKNPAFAGCRSLACVWRSVVLVVIRYRAVPGEARGSRPIRACFQLSLGVVFLRGFCR